MRGLARSLPLLLALAAFAPAACGESDEEQVRQLAELVTESDPARCDRMTDRFMDRFYEGSVESCKRDREGDKWEIGAVTVHGERAVVSAEFADSPGRFKLIKRDGEWKIDMFLAVELPPGRPGADRGQRSPDWPKLVSGLDARETAQAYYKAIENEDAKALCGLLSRRYATEVAGGQRRHNPRGACVAALQDFDWSKTQEKAEGAEPREAIRSGDTATVTLSGGKRALLKREAGRWVVDAIRR